MDTDPARVPRPSATPEPEVEAPRLLAEQLTRMRAMLFELDASDGAPPTASRD